mmetsp:Transcript_42609/g.83324  ORF Transcript_42609/g.83324 Transcript_42609/m.83324 type:complete len:361 (-) Transcript_42609:41-1123(-)
MAAATHLLLAVLAVLGILAVPACGGFVGFVPSLGLSPSLRTHSRATSSAPHLVAKFHAESGSSAAIPRRSDVSDAPSGATGPKLDRLSAAEASEELWRLIDMPLLSQHYELRSPEGSLKEKEEGDKKQLFKVERGKAIDTLLQDYPHIFDSKPDFSIFRDDVSLTDSAGFSASGKTPYKLFFTALRTLVPMMYHRALVSVHVTHKYDNDEGRIRLRWKVELFRENDGDKETAEERRKREALQRLGFTVPSNGHHAPEEDRGDRLVEGISVYHLDESGKIYRHVIESTEPTSLGEAYAKLGLAVGGVPAGAGSDHDLHHMIRSHTPDMSALVAEGGAEPDAGSEEASACEVRRVFIANPEP